MAHLPKGQGVFLPPFKAWLASNIPAVYDNTMTYYEELCALIKYLQDVVIPTLNHNAEAVTTISTAVEQLQKYVEDYFKNLDVQEEINNKLDEMAESGALTEIIAQFLGLGALAVFDTESDMIDATQLIKGSKCKTLGKETLGDGFGAYYNIDETGDIELSNGLFATLIENYGGNNYYDEITVEQITRYDTDCYIITIPVNDSEGNLITPSVEYDTKTPLHHADDTYSTLTVNASLSIKTDTITTYHEPVIIGNGEVLHDYEGFVSSDLADNYVYLGIKADRTIEEFKVNNTTAQQLLNAGCVNVFDAYYKLVEHGVASDLTGVVTNEPDVVTNHNPRQCLGVKSNGDWIILTCDGRTGNDAGLTSAQTQEILIEYGAYDAWNLDGGGSTATIIKGSKINRNIDNNRTTERYIPYTLNFRKKIIDEELAKAYSQIGTEKQNALEQVYESVVQNRSTNISGQDLNTLTDSLIIGYGNGMDNRPSARNGYFINIPHSWAQYRNLYAKQFYYERDSHLSYERDLINGTFTGWRRIGGSYWSSRNNSSQTIDTSDTYIQLQAFGPIQKNGNVITLNDDNTFSFDTNGYGFVKISIDIGLSTVTAGNKYLSLSRNGVREEGYTWRFGTSANGDSTTHTEFTFALQPDAVPGVKDKYGLLVYGKSGDVIRQLYVNISLT